MFSCSLLCLQDCLSPVLPLGLAPPTFPAYLLTHSPPRRSRLDDFYFSPIEDVTYLTSGSRIGPVLGICRLGGALPVTQSANTKDRVLSTVTVFCKYYLIR